MSNDPPSVPATASIFHNTAGASIFTRPSFDVPPQEFSFGAGQTAKTTPDETGPNSTSNIVDDIPMDGS